MSNELCYLPATEALERFRQKKLSPVELLDAVIARTEAVEGEINAFSFTYFDEAREQAREAESAYLKGSARPLEGLATSVKDEPMIAGKVTTNGSLTMQDYVPDYTDILPQRLIDAGAIVHARTTTPEFSAAYATWSRLHGVTRNPWNTELAVGGSSGGAGASLAAGTSTLASGSDIGGSIRIPASMNGVVGFKPPWGRMPEYNPWNREQYAASGPMARTVDDTVLMGNVIFGPHPSDMFSLPEAKLPTHYASIKGMRIAMSTDFGFMRVEPEIRAALHKAAETLRGLGAQVEEVDLGWDAEMGAVVYNHLSYQMMQVFRNMFPDGAPLDDFTPYIRQFFEDSQATDLKTEMQGWAYADNAYQQLQDRVYLAGLDALICPTMATTQIPADYDHGSTPTIAIDGEQRPFIEAVMTHPFNMLGRMPVISVPIGRAGNNIPIGMQIVGPTLRDEVAFRVAKAYETVQPALYNQAICVEETER